MNRYKKLRVLAGLTAAEAARRIQCAASTISHWENGNASPSVKNLHRVARVYGCSVADLLDDDSKKEE